MVPPLIPVPYVMNRIFSLQDPVRKILCWLVGVDLETHHKKNRKTVFMAGWHPGWDAGNNSDRFFFNLLPRICPANIALERIRCE